MGPGHENEQQRNAVEKSNKATKYDTTLLREYMVSRLMRHVNTQQGRTYVVRMCIHDPEDKPLNCHMTYPRTPLDDIGIV